MLVFGDHSERADPDERLAEVERTLRTVAGMAAGIARHSAVTAALIEAGRLLQGVADAAFEQTNRDRETAVTDALGRWLLGIARMVGRSWDSTFARLGDLPGSPQVGDLPESVTLKSPEGFAFYAVYPEAYFEAARRLRLIAPPRVIGIRSIGTTLAAVVAAALDADPPVTVRPFGDAFARQVAVEPALERRLLEGQPHYVIVDEGPGQSGSSFGAVADWLQKRGVPLERIAFLPSHAGPLGPRASEAHRQRWRSAQREVADFGDRLPELVAEWSADVIGRIDRQPDDVSGGEWRRRVFDREADWPPAIAIFERRKILLSSNGGRVLAKFAGLGAIGEAKLRMSQALHAAGFVPEPTGLVHGFLLERWRDDAKPLGPGDRPLQEIGRYIGARARLFPAGESDGASIAELYEMTRRNILLALGEQAARAVSRWERALPELQSSVRPVRTDNRMDPHEWLMTPDGRLLKTDAVDHHQAHDLIGCQDSAWDVAGAMAEFELDPSEAAALIAATGLSIDARLLAFCQLAYAAFRLGQATLGIQMLGPAGPEADRLERATRRYCCLAQLLLHDEAATRL